MFCVCACIIGDLVSEIKALESRRTQGPLMEPMTVPVEHGEECEGARHRQTGAASPSAGGSRDASAAKRGGGREAPAEAGAWLGAGQSGRSVSELIDKVQGLQDRLASCRSRVGSLL